MRICAGGEESKVYFDLRGVRAQIDIGYYQKLGGLLLISPDPRWGGGLKNEETPDFWISQRRIWGLGSGQDLDLFAGYWDACKGRSRLRPIVCLP